MTSTAISKIRLLELHCLVLGDDRNHIFPVKILSTESVGALKKAIKDEKKPAFDHIPADTLVLWEVHILADENLKGNVEKLRLSLIDDESPEVSTPYQNEKEIQSLLPVRNLSEIFSESPVKEHVHIIVKPPLSRSTIKDVDSENNDIITTLRNSTFRPRSDLGSLLTVCRL
jgi:hypothetical protein